MIGIIIVIAYMVGVPLGFLAIASFYVYHNPDKDLNGSDFYEDFLPGLILPIIFWPFGLLVLFCYICWHLVSKLISKWMAFVRNQARKRNVA